MSDPEANIDPTEFEELYRRAQEAMPGFEARANELLENLRAQHPGVFDDVTFEMGNLKDMQTALDKIETRYNGDVSKITDLVRGRFVVQSTEQIEILNEALGQNPDILNFDNRFENPVNNTGFRNLAGNTITPNGVTAEIQVVHQDLKVVNTYTHRQMERVRDIRTEAHAEGRNLTSAEKKEIKQIESDMREANRAAVYDARDPNLNELVTPDRRAASTYDGELRNGSALEAFIEKVEARQAGRPTTPQAAAAIAGLRERVEARNAERAAAPETPRPTAAEVVADTGGGVDTPTTDPDLRGTTELNIPAVDDGVTPPAGGAGVVDETVETGADALRAAEEAARAADAARAAERAADAADARSLARVAKSGKLGVVTTVGVTAGVAGILHYAFGEQRNAAEAFRDAGMFSDDPAENQQIYEEYVELNESVEAEMQTENVAGQGWLFLATTPAVELSARAQFDEFSTRHNLPENVHQALGMSMFDGQSLRGEFAQGAAELIPENMSDFPPELHGLWRAKQEMDDAQNAFDRAERAGVGSATRRMDPSEREAYHDRLAQGRAEATEELSAAQAVYQREFSRAFSDPETAAYLLEQMPQETLIDMVEETAQYNLDSAPPLIREMVEVQQQIDDGDYSYFYDTDAENRLEEIQAELEANPEITHGYIAEVFGGRVDPNTIPDEPAPETSAEATAAFTAMPEFMQNRVIETAARNVDLSGDMEGVHPYMKDMAELYQSREQGSIRTQAGNRDAANARIDEIENEIRSNPDIIGQIAASDSEVQALIDAYNENPEEAARLAAIEESELNEVIAEVREDAQADGANTFDDQHALLRQAARLYDQRDNERTGRGAALQNDNLDAQIREIEDELRENPDVLTGYGAEADGADVAPDDVAPVIEDPQESAPATNGDASPSPEPEDHGALDAGDTGSLSDPSETTPDDVIDRTAEVDQILPPGSNLTVQSGDGEATVARGAVPDNQVALTQGDDNVVALSEVERQREAAQRQEEELRRQQAALYGTPAGQPAAQQPTQS